MSRAEGLRRGNQTAGFVAPPPVPEGDTGIVVPELILEYESADLAVACAVSEGDER